MLLERLPRVHLAELPTPLEELPRFSQALGGPRIFIKRDDLTGLALGGNKARKLEFLMADALQQGADVVITCGGGQSNHARQTAAAAAKLGLGCVLVLSGSPDQPVQGNLLLDKLLGAEVRFVTVSGIFGYDEANEKVAAELRAKGRRPYIIPVGGSTTLGASAYVAALGEIAQQLKQRGLRVDRLFLASGSAGTQAGATLGAVYYQTGIDVIGVSVSSPRDELAARVLELANATAAKLGAGCKVEPSHVKVGDGYIGSGYAKLTPEGAEAIRLLARTEGIILDPVYTGKAMACLVDYVRQGRIGRDENVLFLHTGGAAGLFAFAEEIARLEG